MESRKREREDFDPIQVLMDMKHHSNDKIDTSAQKEEENGAADSNQVPQLQEKKVAKYRPTLFQNPLNQKPQIAHFTRCRNHVTDLK